MSFFRSLLFLILLICVVPVAAQQRSLLQDVKLEKGMVLLGMYPQFDKTKKYERLNFLVSDEKAMEAVKEQLVYGEEKTNWFEKGELSVLLLKNNEIVDRWSISPQYSSIRINGKSYEFNMAILEKLASEYSFRYNFYEKPFTTEAAFKSFSETIRADDNFLFLYKPNFRYEGKFELQFRKNDQFPSPKVIYEYLTPKFKEITGNDNFRIYYTANDYNQKHPEQFTITVEGSYKLYQEFQDKKVIKQNWKENEPSATIFVRTK